MRQDYYQHTQAQKDFLSLLPTYIDQNEQNFNNEARQAMAQIERMVVISGQEERVYPIESSEIAKIIRRAVVPLRLLLGDPDTNWGDADLSRIAREVAMSQPTFGLDTGGADEYAAERGKLRQRIEEVGLGASAASIENAITKAEQYIPFPRIIQSILDDDEGEEWKPKIRNERLEMLGVGTYKRVVAEIMLEDAEHALLTWFELMYMRKTLNRGSQAPNEKLSHVDKQLRDIYWSYFDDWYTRNHGSSDRPRIMEK